MTKPAASGTTGAPKVNEGEARKEELKKAEKERREVARGNPKRHTHIQREREREQEGVGRPKKMEKPEWKTRLDTPNATRFKHGKKQCKEKQNSEIWNIPYFWTFRFDI